MNNGVLPWEFFALALEAAIILNQQRAAGDSRAAAKKMLSLIHDVQQHKKSEKMLFKGGCSWRR